VGVMNFGPALAVAFVLWPVMAVLGGQGFAPLLGLTSLAALALARPRLPPAAFALVGFAFTGWVVASEFWAPGELALTSGNLLEGTFAVESGSLATASLALSSCLVVAAALQSAPAPRASGIIVAMLAVHTAWVIASPYTSGFLLSAVYGEDPKRLQEGAQNFGRSANTLALALPLLLSMLVFRWKIAGIVLSLLLLGGAAMAYLKLDAQAALMALGGTASAIVLVALLPQNGFRWLLGGLAGYIAAAPVLFALLLRALEPFAHSLPASFRSRLWSWEVVIGRMTEAPFMGQGLYATREWRETYATRPEWLAQLPDFWKDYPIVPGHPHNMALQIWAETGMVGAVLAALSLVALGFHLPRPEELRPETRFAVAGLTGAAAVIFSFAYSAWNGGFWSSVAIAAAGIILWHRTLKDAEA